MRASLLTCVSLIIPSAILAHNERNSEEWTGENLFATGLLGSHFGALGQTASFDYLIVGGGTAGLTVARRLASNASLSVAVIEAGGFVEFDNSNYSQVPSLVVNGKSPLVDWNQSTTPQDALNGRAPAYPQGKALGGSSTRNALIYTRGSRGSFNRWADAVQDQSFSFDQMEPYLKKPVHLTPPNNSQRAANASVAFDNLAFSATGGPVQVGFPRFVNAFSSWFAAALNETGLRQAEGFVNGDTLGWSYTALTIDAATQTRSSAETAFLRESLRQAPNVIYYKSTLAKRITFDSDKRATGVMVNTGGVEYLLSARKEVIVSAGVFKSPQLLMVSGIGPAKVLSSLSIPILSEAEGVGSNLQDHIFAGPSYAVRVTTKSSLQDPQFFNSAVNQYNTNRTGPLTNGGADLIGFEKLPNGSIQNSTRADLDRKFGPDWPDVEYIPQDVYSGASAPPNANGQYITLLAGVVAPFSRGNVSIASTDTGVNPIVNPAWLTDPRDREVLLAGVRRMRTLASGPILRQVIIGEEVFPGSNVVSDKDLFAQLIKTATTDWHASGTVKMGSQSDRQAVLNSRCSVRGVSGLRVVDASAFPFLLPGHPTANIYALAEKIAEDILAGRS